jgi:hypothetical protein
MAKKKQLTPAERRKAAVSAVMQSERTKDFINDHPRGERANLRNWVKEMVEAGYDVAMKEASEAVRDFMMGLKSLR